MPSEPQLRKALERLADSTEMAGAGDESQWHGAAAEELRHRIRYAAAALTDEFHAPMPLPVGDARRLRSVPDESERG